MNMQIVDTLHRLNERSVLTVTLLHQGYTAVQVIGQILIEFSNN